MHEGASSALTTLAPRTTMVGVMAATQLMTDGLHIPCCSRDINVIYNTTLFSLCFERWYATKSNNIRRETGMVKHRYISPTFN